VARLSNTNGVIVKWIWTHKRQVNGTLDQYMARWVLRGFTQHPGVDYDETFGAAVKPATVRTVLSLAHSLMARASTGRQECFSARYSH